MGTAKYRRTHGQGGKLPTFFARDKPLSFHWRWEREDWLDFLPALPSAPREQQRAAMPALLFDAAMQAVGAGRRISYSRGKSYYAHKRRYQGNLFTYNAIVPAVDALVRAGFLDAWKAPSGQPTGWQSQFWAGPKLVEAIKAAPRHWIDPLELVRLKNRDGVLAPYHDTDFTDRCRRRMREINEMIVGTDIDLDSPGMNKVDQVVKIGLQTIYLAQVRLYRVFNRDWSHGGRLYGAWWQNCKKEHRSRITINGEATVEPDYPEHHPTLLYRMNGLTLDGPAYAANGVDRPLAKLAWNALLNARSERAALFAVAKNIGGENANARAVEAIEAMKRRHTPIARYFGSSFGLRLQNIDAGMADAVVRDLAGQGISLLPIHDSFRIAARHEGAAREAMEKALETATNTRFSRGFK